MRAERTWKLVFAGMKFLIKKSLESKFCKTKINRINKIYINVILHPSEEENQTNFNNFHNQSNIISKNSSMFAEGGLRNVYKECLVWVCVTLGAEMFI